jgi:hypothetical protein
VRTRYRVWIIRCEGRSPEVWCEAPSGAIAVEPAERGVMHAQRARHYVEAFNRVAEAGRQNLWAVALPVAIRYVGEPRPGDALGI